MHNKKDMYISIHVCMCVYVHAELTKHSTPEKPYTYIRTYIHTDHTNRSYIHTYIHKYR